MSKDYLCKSCTENNNGWCNKLKKQGLKQVNSCEYYNDCLKLAIPVEEKSIDIIDTIETFQKPIKSITLDEQLSKDEFNKKVLESFHNNNLDFKDIFKLMEARALIENHYEWDRWAKEIPYIKFPGNWEVKAIPPFGGAIIRYIIKHENPESENISIYLDCYGELGCVKEPYWELYPDSTGNNFRCGINDTNELLKELHLILDRFN